VKQSAGRQCQIEKARMGLALKHPRLFGGKATMKAIRRPHGSNTACCVPSVLRSAALSQQPRLHPEKASRWIDVLELPQTRGPSGRQQRCGAPGVERSGPETALDRALPARDDPDFESKAADIIGLYLIFCGKNGRTEGIATAYCRNLLRRLCSCVESRHSTWRQP